MGIKLAVKALNLPKYNVKKRKKKWKKNEKKMKKNENNNLWGFKGVNTHLNNKYKVLPIFIIKSRD